MKTLLNLGALIMTLSLPSGVAIADEAVKIFPPGSAQDVLQKSDHPDPANPRGNEGTGAVIVKKDCLSASGKVVKKGQPGYETCLQERLNRAQKDPASKPASGSESRAQ